MPPVANCYSRNAKTLQIKLIDNGEFYIFLQIMTPCKETGSCSQIMSQMIFKKKVNSWARGGKAFCQSVPDNFSETLF